MFKHIEIAGLVTIGTICIVGIILPFLPGAPFLLTTAACFKALEA